MAGAKVTVELDVKDAESVAAWQRARQSIQLYEAELEKTAQKHRKLADEATSAAFRKIRVAELLAVRERELEQTNAQLEAQSRFRRIRVAELLAARERTLIETTARAQAQARFRQIRAAELLAVHRRREFEDANRLIPTLIRQIPILSAIGAGWGQIVQNIGAAIARAADFSDEVEAAVTKLREGEKGAVQVTTASGDIDHAAEIERELGTVPGVKKSEARAAFEAISGSAPGVDWITRLELAKKTARIAPLTDEQGLASVSAVAADLAEADPTRSADDVSDIAHYMRKRAGGRFGELAGPTFELVTNILAKDAGMGVERAAAFELAALEQGLDGRFLSRLGSTLTDRMQEDEAPRTAADRRKNEFARANASERLRMLFESAELADEVLGPQGAAKFRQISPAKVAEIADEIAAAQGGREGGIVGRDLARYRQKFPTLDQERTSEIGLERSHAEYAKRTGAREHEILRATLKEYLGEKIGTTGANATVEFFGFGHSIFRQIAPEFLLELQKELVDKPTIEALRKSLDENTDATKQNNAAVEKNNKQPPARRNDAQRPPEVAAAGLRDR